MKTISYWGTSIVVSALVFNTIGSLAATATTVTNTTTDNSTQTSEPTPPEGEVQLAQLAGECRAANRTIDIFTEPSVGPTTNVVRTLDVDDRVTLAGAGSAGWIPVNFPANGYVIARYLKLCPGNPPPPGATCRTANIALAIRSGPSTGFSLIGTVPNQGVVRLTNPERNQVDATGRSWTAITAPLGGWVSTGFPEGNVGPRFACR